MNLFNLSKEESKQLVGTEKEKLNSSQVIALMDVLQTTKPNNFEELDDALKDSDDINIFQRKAIMKRLKRLFNEEGGYNEDIEPLMDSKAEYDEADGWIDLTKKALEIKDKTNENYSEIQDTTKKEILQLIQNLQIQTEFVSNRLKYVKEVVKEWNLCKCSKR